MSSNDDKTKRQAGDSSHKCQEESDINELTKQIDRKKNDQTEKSDGSSVKSSNISIASNVSTKSASSKASEDKNN